MRIAATDIENERSESAASEPMTAGELTRYSRHITLPEIGLEGQQKLRKARVLCVGAGGLGSPAAMYLAAAGVGTIGLVDVDNVDVTNLQRQVIYSTADVGKPKLEAARARLNALNPHVHVEMHHERFDAVSALRLVESYDVVLDGTDNFPTRYLVNDACVMARTPNAWGSILRFEGQASVFAVPGGPCFRCLHPEPPPAGVIPSCAEAGVLGVLPGIIGTIQATETLKLLLGIGEPLVGRFLLFDALKMRFRTISLPRDPACPVCGDSPSITSLREYEDTCEVRAASRTREISARELKALLDRGAPLVLIDVRERSEFEICRIPGSWLLPLPELAGRLAEVPRDADVVVVCKAGMRSARAAALLEARGFDRVRSLAGGILRWIDEVDPSLPRY